MFKYLLPVFIFLAVCLPQWSMQATQEAEQIASAIASEIQTAEPIFLDLRTGEWTTALSQSLSKMLISRGADLRDNPSLNAPNSINMADSDSLMPINLKSYGLNSAILVQVNLNVKWQEKVEKNFFSYRSSRHPVYSFETRQIHLPDQRIVKINSYDFNRMDAPETEASRLRLRWFEPIVAATAIGSMVFLLWNFN